MAKVSKASSVFCSIKGLEIVVVREGLDRGSVKERRWTKSRLGVRGRMLWLDIKYPQPQGSCIEGLLSSWRFCFEMS